MVIAPKIIFWETTRNCNLKCSFCRMPESDSGLELTTTEALGIVRDIKDTFGTPLLVLSGGEPLLRKDIFEIISYASSIKLPLALASNGLLLGEKQALWLKDAGLKRVSLSFDAQAFQKTKDAALVLQKQGVQFQINSTVTKLNKNEIRPAP